MPELARRPPRRAFELLVLALLAATSCNGEGRATPPAPPPLPESDAGLDAAPTRGDAGPAASWVDAVRRERWADASRQIDALPSAERSRPEVVYARARAALGGDDAKGALALLEGLEERLPLLAQDIKRRRADAMAVVGPFGEAAAYFSARATPESMLKAALAYERANDAARARGLCDRVLSSEHRSRLQEAAARLLRGRLAEQSADKIADLRWIAVHAPDAPGAREADAMLGRLGGDRLLSGQELVARARALADAGRTDDALHALDRVTSAPAPKVARLDELRERGSILYRTRGRSLEAARVLDECAAAGGPHAGEDDFHAARALARADHDEEAIARMSLIARHHPKTTWGEEAQYFVPYLRLLHGEWKSAADGFDEYARQYPAGIERREGARNRAIAHLMNRDFTSARKLFEQVAADETDPVQAARSQVLAALSALRDGDRLRAFATWTEVARSQPLTWPALVARARLAEEGAPVPPAIESRPEGPWAEPLAISLPPPVELLHAIGLDADAETQLEERESQVAAQVAPGRSVEALCTAYGRIGRAKRRFQIARQIPAPMLSLAPTPGTRWAWECAYPEPHGAEVAEAAGGDGSAATLAYAVMRQESSFDPEALSPAHAVGLMQLLPETARATASTLQLPFDEARLPVPDVNATLGVRYLRDLLGRFDERTALAVAAYNAGEDPIRRWLGRMAGMDLDVFVEAIPFVETRLYVAKVMGNFARYTYLKRGDAGVVAPSLSLAAR